MPEGVEIKNSSIILNKWIQNDVLVDIDKSDIAGKFINKHIKNLDRLEEYKNLVCEKVDCKGKLLYFSFDEDHHISCNFGMAAQWSQEKNKHSCFSLTFENFGKLYFNDMRHFGNLEFLNKSELNSKLNTLGIDFLSILPTEIPDIFETIESKLGNTKNIIADDLLDQSIFAGVGNYIRAEALYIAKLDPNKYSFALSNHEIVNLCQAIIDVMQRSFASKGASILTYKNVDETLGTFQFKCYGKSKDDFGNEILKKKTKNDRTLYYCPSIYK